MWVDVKERQPEKAGKYKAIRRAMGGRPDYEDECTFIPATETMTGRPIWENRQGKVITSVEKWWEEYEGGKQE